MEERVWQKPGIEQVRHTTQNIQREQSIFAQQEKVRESKDKGKGYGPGNGGIPPGIQKKIDENNIPAVLIEKFSHIAEAVEAKKEAKAVKKEEYIEETTETTENQTQTKAPQDAVSGLLEVVKGIVEGLTGEKTTEKTGEKAPLEQVA